MFDELINELHDVKRRARMFALLNPLGFLVVNGCALPEYEKRCDEAIDAFEKLRDKVNNVVVYGKEKRI
jgi:hypothetical protein